MESTVLVDPFRCRLWAMHDRLEEHISLENCAEEIESFKEHGQLVPVLGRPVRGDPDVDVELIYGARRLFVARHTKAKLLAEVREISDREAIIAMDLENRQRKDVSPYERGLSYARWLRGGYFESQEEIARSLRISTSQVSRLLKLARLPSVIVGAFDAAVNIRENWGLKLAEILENPERRQSAIRVAREIRAVEPQPPAREVYRRLLASSAGDRKPKDAKHDKVIKGRDGVPLFRIRHLRRSIALVLPTERTTANCLDAIERAVACILEDPPEQKLLAGMESRDRRHSPLLTVTRDARPDAVGL